MTAKASGRASYEDDLKRFSEWLGATKKRVANYPPPPKGKSIRYMMINDLHIPFHNQNAVVYAIEQGKKEKVDTLIVGGDTMDCYALSRFSKFESVSILEEVRQAKIFFDYASRSFGSVVVLSGNHEAREKKHFSDRLTSDELEWLLDRSMLSRVTADMKNVVINEHIVHGNNLSWLRQIGKDVVVGHPERSSVQHLKPVDDFRKWIDQWGSSLGINPRPRMVIIGHTHSAGRTFAGDTMIMENGCLCQFQSYAMTPALYNKPQRLAFTIWDMVDGKVVIDSVNQYYPFAG